MKTEPAFPFQGPKEQIFTDGTVISHGLTKRELFAAMAMQGLIHRKDDPINYIPEICAQAVRYANAFIAELEKTACSHGISHDDVCDKCLHDSEKCL